MTDTATDAAAPGESQDTNAGAEAPETTTTLTDTNPAKVETTTADWRAGLDDDTARSVSKYTSPAELAKGYRALSEKLGKTVSVPGEGATEGQIAAYRKALGLPDSADAYKLSIPQELSDKVDVEAASAALGKYAAVAYEHNIPPTAMQQIINAYYADQIAAMEATNAEREKAVTTARESLMREWGRESDANLAYARRAVNQFDPDGRFKAFLDSAQVDGVPLGDHPEFARLFARAGRMMAEDSVHLDMTPDEKQSVEDQATTLRTKKAEAMKRGDMQTANRLDAEERALYAKAYGAKPLVGAQGRTR